MHSNHTYILLLAVLGLAACSNPRPASPAFHYKTTQEVEVEVQVKALGQPAAGAPVAVFQGFLPDGEVDEGSTVLSGQTDASGRFAAKVTLPADLDAVGLRVDYIGVISEPIKVPIQQGRARVTLDNASVSSLNVVVPASASRPEGVQLQSVNYNYQYLSGFGNWNSLGVPNNLTTNSSKLTSQMLQTINATLPERSPLPLHPIHKNYIAREATSNLVLKDPAEVWLTFVHEGAGYKNAVGYYIYPANNPPHSVSEILDRMIMVYPNASYQGSGGGLLAGNRVKLKYFDGANWSDVFPAGTGIGWFLVANGWRSSSTGVLERSYEQTVFSDPVLNYQLYRTQGMSVEQSAQTVLLFDDNQQTLLLGFEDILRHHGGDQDFNDAVLLVEASPYTAVKKESILVRDPVNPDQTRTADLLPTDDPQAADTDEDGVSDPYDAYPSDPERAFNNYFPAKSDYGTLAFEDLWPRKGDYDFNDVVVDYRINHVTNANSQLVQIQAEFVVKALGGGWHNGFAFATDLLPGQVESVSYEWQKNGGPWQAGPPPIHYSTDRNPNGTEAGQSKAVFFVFDDGYDLLEPSLPTRPFYANVVPEEPYKTPGRVRMTINLTQPLPFTAPGTPPYNPFIVANPVVLQGDRYVPQWQRGVEIHLAGFRPSDKADGTLFKTQDDTTDPVIGRYYIDNIGRPWGLHLPTEHKYVREELDGPGGWVSLGIDIRDGYLKFDPWIASGGSSYKDWYRDLPGYRETSKLMNLPSLAQPGSNRYK